MDLFLNFGLAWISIFIALFLGAAYLSRKAIIKYPQKRGFYIKLNKGIRKNHKLIGIVLIITGLIHGIFSSGNLFTLNLGTVTMLLSIALGVSWMLRKKITGRNNWMHWHRVLVVVFIATIFLHVVDVGGIQVFNVVKASAQLKSTEEMYQVQSPQIVTTTPSSTPSSSLFSEISMPEGNVYMDGTYTGEATGYQPGMVVSVTIKDNIITSVEIIDHNEVSSRFWSTPVSLFPGWIVEAQSTEIDAISGATFTSVGIINAVNDALRKALVSGDIPDDLSLPSKRRR